MTKALALFSGGLDSILAVKVIQDQGVEVVPVTYSTPFFYPYKAIETAKQLGWEIRVVDLTYKLLDVIRKPKYGFGKAVKPCIDCHSLMFRETGEIMKQEGFDFMISGEVLGERPMSQTLNSLKKVEKLSGMQGYILRPLSAKLLEETIPEKQGLVDRNKLLDITGRSRKRQIHLAEFYGIKKFPAPAGGCSLTDKNYAVRFNKLIDLLKPNSEIKRYLEFLNIGRHFKTDKGYWFIVGRNEAENNKIIEISEEKDVVLYVKEYNGPVCILLSTEVPFTKDILNFLAGVCIRYSDAPQDEKVEVCIETQNEKKYILENALVDEEFKMWLI
ncbi:tRNA 4-thiouridine(8) synthase ThiI [bacterium]|nr:tRNA 4-thiouridine(8) synthase ThiI [bacterium]